MEENNAQGKINTFSETNVALPPDLAAYLSKPGFDKLLAMVRKKYESLGRIGGSIKLGFLTPDEKDTLSGLLGRVLNEEKSMVVSLIELERIFLNSRWERDLLALLSGYYQEPIIPRPQVRKMKRDRWLEMFQYFEDLFLEQPDLLAWLGELKERRGFGYRTLQILFEEDPCRAQEMLHYSSQAIGELMRRKDGVCSNCLVFQAHRLPVFAAHITGDPHAFDQDRALGRLLLSGLQYLFDFKGHNQSNSQQEKIEKTEEIFTAEAVRQLWASAGLAGDDISSFVTAFAIQTQAGDPFEQFFLTANNFGTPVNLPLRFFEYFISFSKPKSVYVVENPAVFSTLLDLWVNKGKIDAKCHFPPPLVCSSGQLSVAALNLLDRYAALGCAIWYSGDYDIKGLEIAQKLSLRYKDNFRPWRFKQEDYNNARKGPLLTDEQKASLERLSIPWDSGLIKTMIQNGHVLYQELLIEVLADDWLYGNEKSTG